MNKKQENSLQKEYNNLITQAEKIRRKIMDLRKNATLNELKACVGKYYVKRFNQSEIDNYYYVKSINPTGEHLQTVYFQILNNDCFYFSKNYKSSFENLGREITQKQFLQAWQTLFTEIDQNNNNFTA